MISENLMVFIEAQAEDIRVEDTDYYPVVIKDIQENIEKYGLWGWCYVKLVVEFCGLTGEAGLGGCSYKNAGDFLMEGDNYRELFNQAVDELKGKIERLKEALPQFEAAVENGGRITVLETHEV